MLLFLNGRIHVGLQILICKEAPCPRDEDIFQGGTSDAERGDLFWEFPGQPCCKSIGLDMLDANLSLHDCGGYAGLRGDEFGELIGSGFFGSSEADHITANGCGEFIGSAKGDKFSGTDDADPVGSRRLLHEMRGAEGGDVVLVSEFFQGSPEIEAGSRVESRGGLVEQKHLRTDQEALGDFSPALKSAGEGLDNVIKSVRQVEGLCGLNDAGFEFRSRKPVKSASTTEVLQNGQLAVETW